MTIAQFPPAGAAARTGTIHLVGAGPGDPDLLTLRAARLIGNAHVIVHDGLVGAGILAMAPATARLVSVAKSRARHTMPQEAINQLLIDLAQDGHDVVRLKGGDPFIFGRGGEEAEAARAAGVPVEVVPGVSAALACAAAAQIPLTHRDHASAVTFVAGQCRDLTDQDWSGLAGHGRTLVIYMGVVTATAIADKLMADGVSPSLPVAILEKGGRSDFRALASVLADLGGLVARAQVHSPALLVVGDVAAQGLATDALHAFWDAAITEGTPCN